MGLLDDFLLGRGSERDNLDRFFLRDSRNQRVTRFGPRGLQVEGTDRRASTQGAATALLRTTGRLPEGFFNGPNRSTIIPFQQEGGDVFQRLQNAGIQEGSTFSQVLSALNNGSSTTSNTNLSQGVNNSNIPTPIQNPSRTGTAELNLDGLRDRLNQDDFNNRRRRTGPAPFGSRLGGSNTGSSEAGIDPRNFSQTNGSFLSAFIEDLFNLDGGDFSAINNLSDDNQNFDGPRDLRFLR